MSNGHTPQVSVADLLAGNDPLSRVAGLFSEIAGKEKSPEAIEGLLFLDSYGCHDIASALISYGRYQTPPAQMLKMVEALNKAAAHKELIEAQAKANKAIGGS